MTDRFVEEHARPARTKHYFHLARRSLPRIQLQNSLPRGFLRKILRSLLSEEKIECDATAPSGTASRRVAIGLGNARNIHAGQRL